MPSITEIFNRTSSALSGGSTSSYGGMLSDEDRKAADSQAKMAMAAQLLNAGGYSPNRTSLGQALGQGMGAAQQARQGSVDQSLQAMMLRKQLASMGQQDQDLKAIIDPATGKPKFVLSKDAIGMEPHNAVQRAEAPAVLQEYAQYSKDEESAGRKPKAYMDWYEMRAKMGVGAPFQIADIMGGRALVNRTNPNDVRQLSTADQEATGAATIAGATQSAKTAAESQTQATIDLPRVVNNAEQALKTINDFEQHPGFNKVFGAESVLPTVPGTDQAGALAYYKQIQGKTFLEAFNSLKGAGQITETEGTKAESAIARLERAQKDSDAKKALDDLKSVIESGVSNARKKAGLPPRLLAAPEGKRSREDILKQYNVSPNGR